MIFSSNLSKALQKQIYKWSNKINATATVWSLLTLKHRETHVCVVNTVATDALVLKHQAISIHNAD